MTDEQLIEEGRERQKWKVGFYAWQTIMWVPKNIRDLVSYDELIAALKEKGLVE